MVEWEVRIFFPDNSFGQVLDDNRFSRGRKKEFFFMLLCVPPHCSNQPSQRTQQFIILELILTCLMRAWLRARWNKTSLSSGSKLCPLCNRQRENARMRCVCFTLKTNISWLGPFNRRTQNLASLSFSTGSPSKWPPYVLPRLRSKIIIICKI